MRVNIFRDIKVIPAQKYWLSNVNVLGVNYPICARLITRLGKASMLDPPGVPKHLITIKMYYITRTHVNPLINLVKI